MSLMILLMLFVCIVLPLGYAWRVFRLDEPFWAAWVLLAADAIAFVTLVLVVGRWDMAGYYTRFLILAVFLMAVLWSLRQHQSRPWRTRGRSALRKHRTKLVSLVFFGCALGYVAYGLVPPQEPRELAFPLENGRFVVGQGGSITLLNHHAGHPEQHFAADIVAINTFGYRAAGLAPEELTAYVVFGVPVVSPCAGKIVGSRSDLPDLIPPETDRENPRGNHVIIDCGGFNVEIAHLQKGSGRTAVGDVVSAGQALGKVGNSGNTTEPHLHIHAVDPETRTGLPMSFQGRVPVRNRRYVN